jgi:hypothetical protein
MSELSPELQELEAIEGAIIPYTTYTLSLPLVEGEDWKDPVANITKIHGNAVPNVHFFEVTPINFNQSASDNPDTVGGKIEIDDSQEGDPHLIILDMGMLGEARVLRHIVSIGLLQAGVDRAVVEPEHEANISLDRLERAGGKRFLERVMTDMSGEPLVAFEPLPDMKLAEPIAA